MGGGEGEVIQQGDRNTDTWHSRKANWININDRHVENWKHFRIKALVLYLSLWKEYLTWLKMIIHSTSGKYYSRSTQERLQINAFALGIHIRSIQKIKNNIHDSKSIKKGNHFLQCFLKKLLNVFLLQKFVFCEEIKNKQIVSNLC